jgi:Ca2+-binding RTX toxin-like protein
LRVSILVGTNGNNALVGTGVADLMLGGLGRDTLRGNGGTDDLFGGRGSDLLFGQDGMDTLAGGGGADMLYGDSGSDFIETDRYDLALGGNGAGDIDVLHLDSFGDVARLYNIDLRGITTTGTAAVTYGFGTARAAQFEGTDLAIFDAMAGSVFRLTNGSDQITCEVAVESAGARGVRIDAHGGNDRLLGSERNDTILGGAGTDIINGTAFAGPGGADVLTGGSGADAFLFHTPDAAVGWVADTITDFAPGQDKIVFTLPDVFVDPVEFAAALLIGGANPVATSAAGQPQLLYDTDDGRLFVDINGARAGGVVHVVTLTGRPALTAADLHVDYDI